jgi:hypothetical protein
MSCVDSDVHADQRMAHEQPRAHGLLLAAFTAATFALHLAFHAGYGYFRDELYFLACSEHLDWGYVDQPPGVAVVAWAARRALGDSLLALRLVPMLFAAAQVLLAGLTARAMGGGRYAQTLAMTCVMAAPVYFGSYLNTDMFMNLGWAACAWTASRVLSGASSRLWLLFGLFAGLAFQGKHAIVFFGGAFVAGLLFSAREVFRDRWFWLGMALATVIALPNLMWEYGRHWPTYELLSNIEHSNKNVVLGPGAYLLSNIAYLSPVALPIWGSGLVWCAFAEQGRRFRPFAWSWLLAYSLFVALKGKGYYLAPAYSTLFCAGSVAIEVWIARRRGRLAGAWRGGIAVLVLAGGALFWPFAMPMMPVETFLAYAQALHVSAPRTETQRLGPLPQQYADMFGWPELVATVAGVYASIPAEERAACGIFAANYGEAGAVDHFGRRYGLPPALSGHQNYWLWGPRGYSGECLVVIGGRRDDLLRFYNHVTLAAQADHPYAVPAERHLAIWIARSPKFGDLRRVWPGLKVWM